MSTFPEMGAPLVRAITPLGWDRCQIGSDVLPGLAKISGAHNGLKVDQKSKPGAHPKKPTFLGTEPQPFGVDLKHTSDEERETFAEICSRLQPGGNLDAEPRSFDHPSVRHLKINKVVVTKIHQLVWVSPGVTTVRIDLLPWRPSPQKPKNATTTPKKEKVANDLGKANPTPTQKAGFVARIGSGSVLND